MMRTDQSQEREGRGSGVEADVELINEAVRMRLSNQIKDLEEGRAQQAYDWKRAKEINQLSSKYRFRNGGRLAQASAASGQAPRQA